MKVLVFLVAVVVVLPELVTAKYGNPCSKVFDCEILYEVCSLSKCVCKSMAHLRNGECKSKTFCNIDSDCEDGNHCNDYGICQGSLGPLAIFFIILGVFSAVVFGVIIIVIVKRRNLNCRSTVIYSSGSQGVHIAHVPSPAVSYGIPIPDPICNRSYSFSQGVVFDPPPDYTTSQGVPISVEPVHGKPIGGTPLY